MKKIILFCLIILANHFLIAKDYKNKLLQSTDAYIEKIFSKENSTHKKYLTLLQLFDINPNLLKDCCSDRINQNLSKYIDDNIISGFQRISVLKEKNLFFIDYIIYGNKYPLFLQFEFQKKEHTFYITSIKWSGVETVSNIPYRTSLKKNNISTSLLKLLKKIKKTRYNCETIHDLPFFCEQKNNNKKQEIEKLKKELYNIQKIKFKDIFRITKKVMIIRFLAIHKKKSKILNFYFYKPYNKWVYLNQSAFPLNYNSLYPI